MDKCIFIGAEKRKSSKTDRKYYMLHYGIEVQEGEGYKPMSSMIDEDDYDTFTSNLQFGLEFKASYEYCKDNFGNNKVILKKYEIL